MSTNGDHELGTCGRCKKAVCEDCLTACDGCNDKKRKAIQQSELNDTDKQTKIEEITEEYYCAECWVRHGVWSSIYCIDCVCQAEWESEYENERKQIDYEWDSETESNEWQENEYDDYW